MRTITRVANATSAAQVRRIAEKFPERNSLRRPEKRDVPSAATRRKFTDIRGKGTRAGLGLPSVRVSERSHRHHTPEAGGKVDTDIWYMDRTY